MFKYEYSISGFLIQGSWNQIVEHGLNIYLALTSINNISEKQLKEYNKWRPKINENINIMEQKTSDYISADYSNSNINLNIESIPEITLSCKEASKKCISKVESLVYENLMMKISPNYFDNKLISANLRQKEDYYIFEININNDEYKTQVKNIIESQNNFY